jgi:hypothetical protein
VVDEIMMSNNGNSLICEVNDSQGECHLFKERDGQKVFSLSHADTLDREPDRTFEADRLEIDDMAVTIDTSDDKMIASPLTVGEKEDKERFEKALEDRRKNLQE